MFSPSVGVLLIAPVDEINKFLRTLRKGLRLEEHRLQPHNEVVLTADWLIA